MSNPPKTQDDGETPHMEKQVLPEPMEEFVSDQSVPSKSMQAERAEKASSQEGVHDVKEAGHQENKAESFEPGVEQ